MNYQGTNHSGGEKFRFLVAEDTAISRKVLEMLFAQRKVDAVFVENGRQAVEQIAAGQHFDLILMDIEMPGMNGHEASRYIRTQLNCNTPIVAMSGHSDEEEKSKSRDAGMNEYMTKPIDIHHLFAIADRLCAGASQTAASAKPVFDFPDEAPVLDLSYLQSLSRGNSAFEKHMLNIFMEDIPPQMEELRNAVALANAQQASDVSHKMKSSFKMLGIGKGADLLQQIEDETRNGYISSLTPEQVREVSDILVRSLAEIDLLLGVTR